MITNIPTSAQAGIAMPASWTADVSAAAVRAFPTQGGVPAHATAAVTKRRPVDMAPVCAYTRTTDVVLDNAFPGTSAWSPPI